MVNHMAFMGAQANFVQVLCNESNVRYKYLQNCGSRLPALLMRLKDGTCLWPVQAGQAGLTLYAGYCATLSTAV